MTAFTIIDDLAKAEQWADGVRRDVTSTSAQIAAAEAAVKRFSDTRKKDAVPTYTPPPKPKTRQDLAAEIERRAFSERQPGQTDAKAIVSFMETSGGRALVEKYRAAPVPEPAAPARDTPTHSFAGSEATLDSKAKALALAEGITVPQAYSRLLDTDEGRRLYRAMREEQAS